MKYGLTIALLLALVAFSGCASTTQPQTSPASTQVPPESTDAEHIVALAMEAMGGKSLLRQLHSLKLEIRTVAYRIDDSERSNGPYWLQVGIGTEWFDEEHDRSRYEIDTASAQWPLDVIVINTPNMTAQGVMWQGKRRWSASVPQLRKNMALRPERILFTAASATDLRQLPDRTLHHQLQHVLAFTFNGHPIRLYLDASLYLPSRLEVDGARKGSRLAVMLGDINWRMDYLFYKRQPDGLVLPHQTNLYRSGKADVTTVVTSLEENAPQPPEGYEPPASAKLKAPDPDVAYGSSPIKSRNVTQLATNVWLIKGAWNVMFVHQPNGIVVIETPQSGSYSTNVLDLIAKRFPDVPIKAAVSTTDSTWHIAGIRTYVARDIPVYALDTNVARLKREIEAPRTLVPDALARHPVPPKIKAVSGKTAIGSGKTQLELIPIRGHGDEHMMMVYMPGLHLLYGSSNDFNPLQKPKPRATFNAFELVRRVKALNLPVRDYVAIHTAKMSWSNFRDAVLTQPAISSQ